MGPAKILRTWLARAALAAMLAITLGFGLAMPSASAAAIDCRVGDVCTSGAHSYPDGRDLVVIWHRHNASGSQLSVDYIQGDLLPGDNVVVTSVFVVSNGTTVANTLASHEKTAASNVLWRTLDDARGVGSLIANTPNSYVGWRACYADGRCIQHTLSPSDWTVARRISPV